MTDDWTTELQTEFTQAETARAAGNQGRARVCARRAAGIAIRVYITRSGQTVRTASVIELLDQLQARPELPPDLRQAAARLRLRVTREHDLPVQADLIADARHLCRSLLPDWEG